MQAPIDPHTGQPFPPGAALVRCPRCGRFHRADIWMSTQRCAFSDCGYQGPPAPVQPADPASPWQYLTPGQRNSTPVGRIGLIAAIVLLVGCAAFLIFTLASPSSVGLTPGERTPRQGNPPPGTVPTTDLDLPTRPPAVTDAPPGLLPTLTQPPVNPPSPTTVPTRTLTPSPTPFTCPGMLPSRVKVGEKARVCTKQDRLILREAPARSATEIVRIVTGTEFKIMEGPVCEDESTWWRIALESGLTGWVREGTDATDPYFICPVK